MTFFSVFGFFAGVSFAYFMMYFVFKQENTIANYNPDKIKYIAKTFLHQENVKDIEYVINYILKPFHIQVEFNDITIHDIILLDEQVEQDKLILEVTIKLTLETKLLLDFQTGNNALFIKSQGSGQFLLEKFQAKLQFDAITQKIVIQDVNLDYDWNMKTQGKNTFYNFDNDPLTVKAIDDLINNIVKKTCCKEFGFDLKPLFQMILNFFHARYEILKEKQLNDKLSEDSFSSIQDDTQDSEPQSQTEISIMKKSSSKNSVSQHFQQGNVKQKNKNIKKKEEKLSRPSTLQSDYQGLFLQTEPVFKKHQQLLDKHMQVKREEAGKFKNKEDDK